MYIRDINYVHPVFFTNPLFMRKKDTEYVNDIDANGIRLSVKLSGGLHSLSAHLLYAILKLFITVELEVSDPLLTSYLYYPNLSHIP